MTKATEYAAVYTLTDDKFGTVAVDRSQTFTHQVKAFPRSILPREKLKKRLPGIYRALRHRLHRHFTESS